jgi:hypothetical protein
MDVLQRQRIFETIKTSMKTLVTVLVCTYEDFKMSAYWVAKCGSLLNTLVKEGILVKGIWSKRRRVGFYTTLILCDAFLQTGLEEGCASWDIRLSKLLSVVLIAACACRSGDITHSSLYTEMEYLTFGDITLSFKDGDQLKDLHLDITLRAEKGTK